MSLDFISVKDGEGAAVYILHHPAVTEERRFESLKAEIVEAHSEAQVVLLSVASAEGERLRDFYDLLPESLPAVLVVADDDSLLYQWRASEIPAADVICHHLSQSNG